MVTMTKQLVLSWDTTESRDGPIADARDEKIGSMVFEERTDNAVIIVDGSTGIRKFVDQAAAQEFLDFMINLASSNNRTVTGTISDI